MFPGFHPRVASLGIASPNGRSSQTTVEALMSTTALASLGRSRWRGPLSWGVPVGVAQAATPLVFWWLDAATVYAIGLVLIAAVYIGFAVADGRRVVLGVEIAVAAAFVIIATAGAAGSPWLLVVGLLGHGLKDLWQHRRQFVENTRWWPPFCAVVDGTAAAIIAAGLVAGMRFHH
jgi:hypothetical protein